MAVGASMTEVTGGTPVVQLRKVVPAGAADVFVKLEWFNPTGSYKDRMALAMVEEAERRGDLRPGMTVVEYTGGSTGSSLAFVCAAKGYRFRVVSSDAFAPEKLKTMQAFGAELTIVPSDGGRITPDLVPRMMRRRRSTPRSRAPTGRTRCTMATRSSATAGSARSCSTSWTGRSTSSAPQSAPPAW